MEDNRPQSHSNREALARPQQARGAQEPEPEPKAEVVGAAGLSAGLPMLQAPPTPPAVARFRLAEPRRGTVPEADATRCVPASSSSATAGPAPTSLLTSSVPTSLQGKTLQDYHIIGAPVGEGTYGTVYRAECKRTGRTVALKHVSLGGKEKDEFPMTTIREIRNLRRLRHANVVELLDICTRSSSRIDVYLVFEYCPHDLTGLMAFRGKRMKPEEIKCIMRQLLEALDYCHYQHVIHRDIKPSNVLLDSDGTLKLCDFGLSRDVEGKSNYSTRVITLWYRPPELLLGVKMYDESVDVWSAGCILGELLFNYALFPESTEVQMLHRICKRQGLWTEEKWPEPLRTLPLWEKNFGSALRKRGGDETNPEGDLFPSIRKQYGPMCEDLLRRMLAMDPDQRCDCSEAQKHRWFSTDPQPCPVEHIKIASTVSCHELDVKRMREKKRTEQQQPGHDASKRPAMPDGEGEATKRPRA